MSVGFSGCKTRPLYVLVLVIVSLVITGLIVLLWFLKYHSRYGDDNGSYMGDSALLHENMYFLNGGSYFPYGSMDDTGGDVGSTLSTGDSSW